jgi:y4mF family transcriptional regulator
LFLAEKRGVCTERENYCAEGNRVNSSSTKETVNINDVSEIGRAVRTARKAQGLTQREFSDLCGVGVRFLSELERGKPTAEVGLVLEVLTGAGYDIVLHRRGLSSPYTAAGTAEHDNQEGES